MADQAANSTSNEPVFNIQRIYLKDASMEQPNSPQIFLEQDSPAVDITQCWYVGDDERDIQAARAAHMPCAIAAGWGYAPSSALHHWGADAVCSHPAQILDILASA